MDEQCCWWCTLKIPGEIFHLPYKYDDRTRKFSTIGNFCSWECMKSYNLHENKRNFGEIQNNMTLYRLKLYGKRFMSLKCAPSRYCLTKFGGTFSEEEFRKNVAALPPVVTTPQNEFFIHKVVIREDTIHVTTETRKKKRLEDIKNSTHKTETLKLKRPVPIVHKPNNIENALGLIRRPPKSTGLT